MTRNEKYVRPVMVLLATAVLCGAQSHDPKNPTPLGPGINKGNVDNKQNGPNYYYFYAEPGRLELHYAFKNMGVFGSPFRQSLSFDLFDEDNKLVTHSAIISVEKMETLSTKGNLDSRHKLLLRVISPQTALRLGGYYEIEVTGAAAFQGRATGPDVKPEGTSLYLGGGSLYKQATVSLTGPTISLLHSPMGALVRVQDSPKELRLTLAADILFDFDRSSIRPDAQAALNRVTEIIQTESEGVIRIEGFTDSKGAADYNLRLSQARAESVKRWLNASEALRSSNFTTQGFGATRFVAENRKPDGSDDPAGRQKNRRVEIILQKRN